LIPTRYCLLLCYLSRHCSFLGSKNQRNAEHRHFLHQPLIQTNELLLSHLLRRRSIRIQPPSLHCARASPRSAPNRFLLPPHLYPWSRQCLYCSIFLDCIERHCTLDQANRYSPTASVLLSWQALSIPEPIHYWRQEPGSLKIHLCVVNIIGGE
jgi:hypothetical protein